MKTTLEQYKEIKDKLDLNQIEYKEKQDILLKQLQELQDKCRHYNTELIMTFNDPYTQCKDCFKILGEKR